MTAHQSITREFTNFGWETVASQLNKEFRVVDEWSDYFRRVWINENELKIISYCEGDIDTQIFETKESYQNALKEISEFYGEE